MSGSGSSGEGVSAVREATGSPAVREMHRLLGRCERDGTAVFLFGSEARIVYMLRDKVGAAFPQLKIAGICDADFEGCASPAIVDFIAGTKPGLIILDMGERQAAAFSRANGHRFPEAPLVHFDGAFGGYVLPRSERAMLSRGVSRFRAALRQSLAAVRFGGIILAQLLQGGMSRVRVARNGAAMRRD